MNEQRAYIDQYRCKFAYRLLVVNLRLKFFASGARALLAPWEHCVCSWGGMFLVPG